MIRVVVADDHAMVREGLKRLVQDRGDMEVVAEAVDDGDAISQCRERPVDVLLFAVSLPGPGLLETLRRMRREHPDLKILVLSRRSEEKHALRALRAGAAGYLTKEHSPEELTDAIRQVHAGHRHVAGALTRELVSDPDAGHDRPPHESLSNRELQILRLLGSGKTVTEIARTVNLSPKTVSTYRTRVLSKMKMGSTLELMRYVLEHDLYD